MTDDLLHEGAEVLELLMGAPDGAQAGPVQSVTVTINDDDPVPSVAFDQASISVDESAGSVALVLALDAVSGLPVTVDFDVSGTADLGDDVALGTTQLTIPPGVQQGSVSVSIVDDFIDEPTEQIVLGLTSAVGAQIGQQASVALTVLDNDPEPTIAFETAAVTTPEAGAVLELQAVLTGGSAQEVSVQIGLSGTAVSGDDFTGVPTSLSSRPDRPALRLRSNCWTMLWTRSNESIVLAMGSPTGAVLAAPSSVTVTVLDDDLPPSVAIVTPSGP